MALFKAKNLTFSYPLSDKAALKNVDLRVEQGEFILVMGKSGSGKSTLLRLLKKEIAPVGKITGEINIDCDSIGFVGQNPETSFVCDNVRSELAFALENEKYSNDEITVRIGETASFFNLNFLLDKKIDELSGGEKASVAIASAMISDVRVLLLDEPLSQLDPKAVTTVSSMLKRINEELGVTVIVVSHSSEEFIDFCDRLVILENGEIICNDTPDNAKNNASLLPYFPVCTRLFDERPLNIKSAVSLAKRLRENPIENQNKSDVCVNLKNITFAYNKNQRDILSRLNFKAYKAQINCIIGANGSGKTTLLKVIAGIKKQYSGSAKTFGKCAYMPQNVKYLFTKDLVKDEIRAEIAEKLGIADCLNQHPFDLSGGQAQKLAFGILLEQNADILLLDEPTKAFDEFSKNDLKSLLFELKSQGKTIITVSHDLDFVGDIADNVSFLSDGIISKAGGKREVFSSLNFYTTQIRRITKRYLSSAVSMGDIV